jgi:anti-sigma regulatory factor (Ser/Thr protein kinase)
VTPHLDIPVIEASQVGDARRTATRLAASHGLDETACGRIALVVTELGTNLVRHARRGRLLLGCASDAGGCRFEAISIDHGPGMADVARCLRDGYSSGGTAGTGLGAVRRLSSGFSIHSQPERGTVVLSRVWIPAADAAPAEAGGRARVAYAGVSLAAPGETVSGDAWDVRIRDGRLSALLADGLGHGPVAAAAADRMVELFRAAPAGSPAATLERAHTPMRETRGAAVAIAELDPRAGTLAFAGAGNISGRLISGVEDRSLMSQHGTLGLQIRRLQDVGYAWPEHAVVVLHSDGLTTRWRLDDAPGLLQCDPAVIAGWLLREHVRGHDDATVVVLKRE